MALERGTRLGPYEIVAPLGAGGMGEVYRAKDPRLGREVAVKVLPGDMARDPDRLRRFELEARAASSLNHPNILTIHDVGTEGDVSYLVTELLHGETLRDLLGRGPLPPHRSVEIARQVARGLGVAHREGIVHRDLKPENLFLTRDGVCKILDFGLARMDQAGPRDDPEESPTLVRTSAGTVLGSTGYMAPEQVRGDGADARSDLFSLGIVLHEMLSGINPFRRKTVVESLNAILNEEAPPLSSAAPTPPGLESVVERCLEKDPDRRFPSAGELGAALDTLSTGVPVQAPRRSGGRPLLVGAVIVALALAVLWLVVLRPERSGTPATAIRSLAVLPFTNLSSATRDEYFSDGMTDMLTTELARIRELKVIARNSATRFKDSSLSSARIAEELDVAALVSGSVLRDGDRVRISAQLAEAGTDRVIWADSYERHARDTLSLQGEVAQAIAAAISLQLSPDEHDRLTAHRSVDPRAFDEYLRGRVLWNRRTEEAVRASLEHFRAAVERAPDFAQGYVGIADAYLILGGYNWMEPRQAVPLAFDAVAQAIALDPRAAEPHATRGDLATHYLRDFELAARELDLALELNPGYVTAYFWRGEAAFAMGRLEDAVSFFERGLERDPMYPFGHYFLGELHRMSGRPKEARRSIRRALEISPDYALAERALVFLDLEFGDVAEAVARARRAVEGSPDAIRLGTLGVAQAVAGEHDEAQRTLARLEDLRRERWVSPLELFSVAAALGDRTSAVAYFREAVEVRDFRVGTFKHLERIDFRSLQDDPEFQALIASIGRTE